MTDEKPWWYPVLPTEDNILLLREEYGSLGEGMDDNQFLRVINCDGKYLTNFNDNHDQIYSAYDELADAYLELLGKG